MKVIIDCNVWISFLLGFQKELMHNVLTNEHIDVYVCPQLMYEIRDVASRPKIRSRIAEDDLEQLFRLIKTYCISTNIQKSIATQASFRLHSLDWLLSPKSSNFAPKLNRK